MHLIHQHRFELQVSDRQQAQELHRGLGDLMNDVFYPRLEKLFENYQQPEAVRVLEQVELNIPDLSFRNWKESLVEQMLLKMEEILKENIARQPGVGKEDLQYANSTELRVYAEQLLLEFLKTGILAPNVIVQAVHELPSLIKIFSHELRRNVFMLLLEDEERIIRLINHFNEEVWQNLLPVITYANGDMVQIKQFASILFTDQIQKKKFVVFLQIWFYSLREEAYAKQELIALQPVLKKYFSVDVSADSRKQLIDFFQQKSLNDRSIGVDVLLMELAKYYIPDLTFPASTISILESEIVSVNADLLQPEIAEVVSMPMQKESNVHFVYVQNAGLIILHPFLQNLFQKLDYLDESNKIQPEKLHRAICLTQYLVNGQEEIFEYDLLLNKVLCGVSVDAVIDTGIKFSKAEKQMAQDLLNAVIEHWTILKTTSIAGLQQTFLQRSGKLVLDAETYALTIEEQGVDVLLKHIPWSISFIFLHWMKKPMQTHWV